MNGEEHLMYTQYVGYCSVFSRSGHSLVTLIECTRLLVRGILPTAQKSRRTDYSSEFLVESLCPSSTAALAASFCTVVSKAAVSNPDSHARHAGG